MADQLTAALECVARDLEACRDGLQNILDQVRGGA
jgi:hypothetical protein